jgi:hypothetical protein
MTNKYTASFFISKLSGARKDWNIDDHLTDAQRVKLDTLVARKFGVSAFSVNDGASNLFPQKTPRTRVLAALRKIAKKTAKYNPRKTLS